MIITLQHIFDDLEEGELNQFSFNKVIDSDDEGFTQEDWPVLVRQIRLGLTALHTRFVIRERELTLNLLDEQSFYNLDSRYSVHSTGPEEPKFIQDLEEDPFTDDIIQVRRLWDGVGGQIPLNDKSDPASAHMNTYKRLQYAQSGEGQVVFLTYQADHPPIPTNFTNPSDVEIEIPDYLREPLYLYVTSRLLSRSQSLETKAAGQQIMNRYQIMCDELDRRNTLNTRDSNTNTKLEKAGWV